MLRDLRRVGKFWWIGCSDKFLVCIGSFGFVIEEIWKEDF